MAALTFKKSLTLLRGQFVRNVYELNTRELSFLVTKYLKAPDYSQGSIGIKPILVLSRNYAKSRDIKKDKKKTVRIDENELAETFDVEKLRKDFAGPVEYFKTQLIEHVSLRSTQGSIENLKVQYEGKTYTMQDLAQVGKKSDRMYVLDFSAFPQTIQAALQVIQSSELNLNAQEDGTRVFVPIPKVTKEHRELLLKKCKGYFNNCKDTLRDIQNKYLRNLKAQEGLNSNLRFSVQEQLYALTQQHAKKAEELLKAKEAELSREEKN